MNFRNGQELLMRCHEESLPISDIMKLREITNTHQSEDLIQTKLETVLRIMKQSARKPIAKPGKSIGGLIGGEARKVSNHARDGKSICGSMLSKAIAYSLAVLETNASMGLIVAAPTAGSSGVLPGTLLAAKESLDLSNDDLYKGLLNASAIGYLLMRNASVSGAEAGCQAEVGAASAMAASALVEMLGGTPEMCLEAASFALSNLLGLVCDPIAGLVESPCQSRNAIGVANAITSAELVLSGVTQPIPFDEMAEAMLRVGRSLPFELRETAMGGCAGTPTGCALGCQICGK